MSSAAASSSAFLRAAVYAPATFRTYDKHYHLFLAFSQLRAQRLKLMRPSRIDHLLCMYIGHLHSTGRPYTNAVHALSGLVYHHQWLREKLPEARLRLRGWARSKQTTSHPPISWELLLVFALTMAQHGYHAEAVACLLSFDCYLRVSEMLRIRLLDVLLPHDARVGSAHTGMAVRLPKTKTGLNQWVSLRSQRVSTILLTWLRHRRRAGARDDDCVFPFSADHFRHLIRRVGDSIGVGSIPFVPHSFRHGGATTDFLR